jgi:predicted metalloendopeptidase
MRSFESKVRLSAILLLTSFAALSVRADIDPGDLDPLVKPQDDFFNYVNGIWAKRDPIPADRSYWGVDVELSDRIQSMLRKICEASAAKGQQGSLVEREVGDFYASAMDQSQIDASGVTPIKSEFERISTIKTSEDVMIELGHLHSLGIRGVGFQFYSSADDKNSVLELAQLKQGGLGLPDRDYYFRDDEKSRLLRSQYVEHVARMFELLGEDVEAAQIDATAVMRIETNLAHASLSKVVLRDPYARYHKMLLRDAGRLTPDVDWPAFLKEAGAPTFDDVNFAEPEFFKTFDHLLIKTSIPDWISYLRWNLIHFSAPYLSQAFERENFDFYGQKLWGTKEMLPRWKRTLDAADNELGEALGQLFAAAFFPPEARSRAINVVDDLKRAFRNRLSKVEWMDQPTKEKALAKLDALSAKIGYPDKWRDYSSATINRGPYILNILQLEAYDTRRNLKKIGGPVDKSEWSMTPQTVNAYYNASNNEIVLPAGILQPPFFDSHADDAYNYGAIGVTIGHEMTHGFDDWGRKYDAAGNLTDWWSQKSAEHFKEHAQAIVKQFSAYTVLDGLHVNGELTEGENIADLGGLLIAYDAFESRMLGKPRPKVQGFTPEQRFFISYAMSWREQERPELLRLAVQTNPHSPEALRTNGPLSNLLEFSTAFNVPEDSPMRRSPEERVVIW